MAHAPYLRDKARSMRMTHRLSIDELSERLGLSRSTIYSWVRDLPIPGSGAGGGWPASAQRAGTRAMERRWRERREAAYRRGLREFDELCAFWRKALELGSDEIKVQRKSNSNQLTGRHWRSSYGVLTVCVNDTLFRSRLQAWMDRLRSEWH